MHREAVLPVRLNGRVVDERTLRAILAFVVLYLVLFLLGAFVLVIDASITDLELSPFEGIVASATTLGNVGPGVGFAGPMGSFAPFSDFSTVAHVRADVARQARDHPDRRAAHPAVLACVTFAPCWATRRGSSRWPSPPRSSSGAAVLMIPAATAGPGGASFLTAVFTSTSAVCVTGLVVVDTPTYWSELGQAVIMVLIQIGGFGIMTFASVLALIVARRLGLRSRLIAQAETGALDLGEVRRILLGVALFSLLFEAVAAVVLALRLGLAYDYSAGEAVWRGIFHAISAFNNAGFALWSDSMMQFVTDGWISITVSSRDHRRWARLPRLARAASPALDDATLVAPHAADAPHDRAAARRRLLVRARLRVGQPGNARPARRPRQAAGELLPGGEPRTAGFNSIDYAQLEEPTTALPGRPHVHRRGQRVDGRRHQGDDVRAAAAHGLDGDSRGRRGQCVRTADRPRRPSGRRWP